MEPRIRLYMLLATLGFPVTVISKTEDHAKRLFKKSMEDGVLGFQKVFETEGSDRRICARDGCNNPFNCNPSKTKKYCSNRCKGLAQAQRYAEQRKKQKKR